MTQACQQTQALTVISDTITAEINIRRAELDALTADAAALADEIAFLRAGKKDRRDAAWAQIGASLGETWGSTIGPIRDEFLGWLHPDWRRMEEGRTEDKRLKSVEVEGLEADIADMRARLNEMGAPTNGMPDIHASGRTNLQLRLREMEAELQRAREVQGAATETPVPELPSNVPRAKPGRLPGKQSSLIPDIGDTAGHLQSAGSEAGAKFAAALEAETKRLGSVADNLESRFSFTATPTISPQFSAGSGSASPAAATRSSAGGAGPVVHQTFNGTSDPQRTARYATREQNRAIRRSRNRALHDLGSFA
ncbi:hypothetical protein BKI51_21790 [Alphaproteobacteria bacterium AO1-B]|nr:hypothetical protein BKI51_21790 [Alphaproteobacteria bacterium AO1-B]